MRILRSANTPFFMLHLLGSQMRAEMAAGHEVFVAAGQGDGADELGRLLGGRLIEIHVPRDIEPWADLKALWSIYRLMRRLRPDIAHSTTPKSGLLFAISAFLACVPIRLHTFTGQPWVEMRGLRRFITRACDRLIVMLNTQNYCDSLSQQRLLESEGIGTRARGGGRVVVGRGCRQIRPADSRAARSGTSQPGPVGQRAGHRLRWPHHGGEGRGRTAGRVRPAEE
jgi:hypothetical protein